MSSLIIEVCRVDKVEPHPQADKMAVATIKGWKTCIRKNEDGSTQFNEGDLCVFVPPDAILTKELSDKLGVTNYLKQLGKNADGTRPEGGRVAVSRLRSQPSYGFITNLDILSSYYTGHGEQPVWKVGDDVAGLLGITKWEPPVSCTDGDAERPHPAFHRYFDLENYRNFPDVIPDGEPVVFTEKLHGKNCRLGYIRDTADDGSMTMTWMAGSHDVRRKEFVTRKRKTYDKDTKELKVEEYQDKSQFWQALDKPGVRAMMEDIALSAFKDCNVMPPENVVVFGEIFGSGVQDMAYGMDKGAWDFRVFDITVNHKYLPADEKYAICAKHGVQTVPVLYDGPFSKERVEEFVTGATTVCPAEVAGTFKGREGIVITAKKEQTVTRIDKVFDRMALKAINFDYLERKGGTEFH